MADCCKRIDELAVSSVAPSDEMSWATLRSALGDAGPRRLVFSYGGRETLPGFHVTEVKNGAFTALDCGANPEAWSETFIQLWDVPEEPGRAPLSVRTFLAIMQKVAAAVGLDDNAKLTFEVSDGVRPMELYRIETVARGDDAIRIALVPRASSCKPRDRWLAKEQAAAAACCGPASTSRQLAGASA